MEAPIEPTRFDTIILGTGLQESIVAGALARAGRKVLHLDCSSFYGSHFASVDLDFFKPWAERDGTALPAPPPTRRQPLPGQPQLQEVELPSSGCCCLYSGVSVHDWSAGLGLDRPRSYSIDLCGPRVLHCGGSAVDLLVASGASQYLEFKALEALLTWTTHQQGLQAVPGSRSDVFQDRSLSLVDKRHLMRFLKLVADLAPLSHTTPWDTPLAAAREAGAPRPPESGGVQGERGAQDPGGAQEPRGSDSPKQAASHPPEALDSEASVPPLDEGPSRAPGEASTGAAGDAAASSVQNPSGQGLERGGHGVFEEFEGQTMEELLESQKLPRSIQECILYGVADASAPSPGTMGVCAPLSAPEGLARLALYFRSIGRFGARSGLIYPSYGCGEIPQAFCRIAAVKGALYVLQRDVASLLVEKESGSACGVHTVSGQSLWAPQVLLGPSYVPEPQAWDPVKASGPCPEKGASKATAASQGPALGSDVPPSAKAGGFPGIARAVCITDRSLQKDKQYLLLSVPPPHGAPKESESTHREPEESSDTATPRVAVRLCQLPASCSVCPPGKFLVYASAPLWRPEEDSPERLLRPALDRLLDCSWGQSTKACAGGSSTGDAQSPVPLTSESRGMAPVGKTSSSPGAPRQAAELAGGSDSQNVSHAAEAAGAATSSADPLRESSSPEAAEQPQGPRDVEERRAGPGPETQKPRVLWCALFTQRVRLREDMQSHLPAGVFCCSSPDATDNFEAAVAEAHQIFAEMAPGEPYYPPKKMEGIEEEEEGEEKDREEEPARKAQI